MTQDVTKNDQKRASIKQLGINIDGYIYFPLATTVYILPQLQNELSDIVGDWSHFPRTIASSVRTDYEFRVGGVRH